MVRLYCFLRLNLKTSVFPPRPWEWMVPLTTAPETSLPDLMESPSTNATTRPSSTAAPTSPVRVSTSMDSPAATRYCFPPASMTAYITGFLKGGLFFSSLALCARGTSEASGYYRWGGVGKGVPPFETCAEDSKRQFVLLPALGLTRRFLE